MAAMARERGLLSAQRASRAARTASTAVLTLSSAGNDVTGTMHGPQGEIEIDEGKLDGATVSWVVHAQVPIPMDVAFTATIAGDEITGEAQLGAMGTMTISGTRMES